MHYVGVLAATLLVASARAQTPSSIEGQYGPPEPEDLEVIAHNGTAYHRRHVIVRGVLRDLVPGQYLSLSAGTARLMLIPLDPSDVQDFGGFMGTDVQVTGIARVLPAAQKLVRCRAELMPESKCEDPLLPVLPDARVGWPNVSITVIKLVDRGTGPSRRSEGAHDLADTGIAAAAADGQPVTAIGQFRGANLCRDLPEPTRRGSRDWVLLTPEGPVWITGSQPQGRGFRLDPAYRGDVNRWLEVTGRVAVSGDVRTLKADKVALIARPPEAEPAPCAP